jgi:hypothetical protein
MKQLELFILSDEPCRCDLVNHSLTEHDYRENLIKLEKIKDMILNTGFDLSSNYYYFHNKLNLDCNAWKENNIPYLTMRSSFRDELKKIYIPLNIP